MVVKKLSRERVASTGKACGRTGKAECYYELLVPCYHILIASFYEQLSYSVTKVIVDTYSLISTLLQLISIYYTFTLSFMTTHHLHYKGIIKPAVLFILRLTFQGILLADKMNF